MVTQESNAQTSAKVMGLISFLLICMAVGGLGAIATTPEIAGWYQTVSKPAWNPPSSIFGPVWTTLYVMMGISGWLIWLPGGVSGARLPLTLFAVQLGLNLAWSWIFFHYHQIGWALVEIVVLWCAILLTTLSFFKRSKLAGSLFIPYLLWVSFAAFLNYTIWQLSVVP